MQSIHPSEVKTITSKEKDELVAKQVGSNSFHMGVSKNRGGPPQIIHLFIGFSIIFTKSILGYPYFWKHPYNGINSSTQFRRVKLKQPHRLRIHVIRGGMSLSPEYKEVDRSCVHLMKDHYKVWCNKSLKKHKK